MRSFLPLFAFLAAVAGGILWYLMSSPAAGPRTRNKSVPAQAPAATGGNAATGNLAATIIESYGKNGPPKLTPEQVAAYVESQQRSATSLLAAWQLTHDDAWLQEAAEKSPDGPQVAVAMLIRHGNGPGAAEWIGRLKQGEPDNALSYLHAAGAAFAAGSSAAALSELAALDALSNTRLDLHTQEWQSAMTSAYASAGHSGLEAEIAAMMQTPLAVNQMHSLGESLGAALSAALDRGDKASATRLGEQGMKAAAVVGAGGGGKSLVTQLIGVSMERSILNQMHSFDLIPGGQPLVVVERLAEMDKRIIHINALIKGHSRLISTLTDSEFRQYVRRVQVEGELKAMEWVAAQRR